MVYTVYIIRISDWGSILRAHGFVLKALRTLVDVGSLRTLIDAGSNV